MSDDTPATDVIFPTEVREDGSMRVIRLNEDGPQFGIVRPLKNGESMSDASEIIRMTPCGDHHHVETVHRPERKSGPSTAATKSYRDNWESIFGKKSESNQNLN